ncbi:Hypothetical predicted protein [Xyrichtys novacula]|uniref:Uncharacterized protein n=1 Tax=Xyrichtys novacula TaxID=13765 RepID=A0AAV1GIT2_XYRNO|nr:Hypothetical predicted protein [Xyrichtys novacula]
MTQMISSVLTDEVKSYRHFVAAEANSTECGRHVWITYGSTVSGAEALALQGRISRSVSSSGQDLDKVWTRN